MKKGNSILLLILWALSAEIYTSYFDISCFQYFPLSPLYWNGNYKITNYNQNCWLWIASSNFTNLTFRFLEPYKNNFCSFVEKGGKVIKFKPDWLTFSIKLWKSREWITIYKWNCTFGYGCSSFTISLYERK